MTQIAVKEQPVLLNGMMEGVGQAIGACDQLLHALRDPRWRTIRDMLKLLQEGINQVAVEQMRSLTPHK